MKPKREITLGEMKDECIFRGDNCETIGGDRCKFFELCATMQTIDKGCLTPIMWNLTDPPRFTDAQMAFFRGCYGIGIVAIMRSGDGAKMHLFTKFETIGFIKNAEIPLEIGETLDLAELLGKDAT